MECIYFQTYTIMPKSFYGIRNDIKWRMKNEEGQLDEFIYKKGERDSNRNPNLKTSAK